MQESLTTRPVGLPGLTGLRGVGAIWVVLYHAQYGMQAPVAEAGYLGVDLFFILSGFVLSHAHPGTQWTWTKYRAFLQTRAARIFPMHWAALALIAATLVLYPKVYSDMPERFQWPDLISSTLLMQNWGFGNPLRWNAPAWSLSTEWLASICFPLFLVVARRAVRPMAAALSCIGCLGAFGVFLLLTHNPNPDVISRAGIVRTFCEVAAGCLLYRVYSAGVRVNIAVALAGAALILAGVLAPTMAILAVFGFPVLILLAAQPSHPMARGLSTKMMRFLGEISYSVYLLHWILLQVSNRAQAALHVTGVASLVWFCCFLGLVIAMSTGTYRLIEVPARRRLRAAKPAPVHLLETR